MVPPLGVEPARRRLRPSIFAAAKNLPEALGVLRIAGEAASHSDDGDIHRWRGGRRHVGRQGEGEFKRGFLEVKGKREWAEFSLSVVS